MTRPIQVRDVLRRGKIGSLAAHGRLSVLTFDKVLAESKGDLGKRQEAIDGLVKPMAESLQKFDEHVRGLEKSRQEAYTSLKATSKSIIRELSAKNHVEVPKFAVVLKVTEQSVRRDLAKLQKLT